jgi:methylenetetrahydrofolate--tRNA-(uracil-5-)-methyltransferase
LQGDYINCPFSKDEYYEFVHELEQAKRIPLKSFEIDINRGVDTNRENYYEACLPVEILARRGKDTLAYGTMRPVGLRDPKTKRRPFAVVQLRQDNLANTLYNLVGFQTNLVISEQERIFKMIPGLQNGEFVRYGQMHRNLFINSPALLNQTLSMKDNEDILFAGQITGAEGYVSSIGTGLLAGINVARLIEEKKPLILPGDSMLGALIYYITHASINSFQPMKANFGLLPELEIGRKSNKSKRRMLKAEKALASIERIAELIS